VTAHVKRKIGFGSLFTRILLVVSLGFLGISSSSFVF